MFDSWGRLGSNMGQTNGIKWAKNDTKKVKKGRWALRIRCVKTTKNLLISEFNIQKINRFALS